MASKKFIINPDIEAVSSAVKDIQTTLTSWKCKSEQVVSATLSIEELLVDIIQANGNEEKIHIYLNKGLRKTYAKISFKGGMYELKDNLLIPEAGALWEDIDPTAENAIHEMILKIMKNRFSTKYSRGVNTIRVAVETSERAELIDCLMAIAIAIVLGLTLRNILPDLAISFIASDILQPIYIIFLRAMQMVVAPLIFFSLASSISGLSDLSSLGRTGGKIMTGYLCTTLIAIMITLCIAMITQPGLGSNIVLPEAGATNLLGDVPEINPSMKMFVINLMPNNLLGTFVASDMLQIIVLAILCAVCTGHMGKYSGTVKKGIDIMNTFFSTLTSGISKMLPFAIFGSFGSMMLTIDFESMKSISYWGAVTLLSSLIMAVVYCLMVLVIGRLNPIVFVKKYFRATFTAFSSSSSSATMPTSMECCRKLGISPSIYNFSIPLGSTINMDGSAILFLMITMFLCNVYGIHLDINTTISMITMLMLISLAMPGIPGVGVASMMSLLAIVGVPAEGLTIVLGLMPLLELVATALNVTGDGTITTIVAKTEGKIDIETYQSK